MVFRLVAVNVTVLACYVINFENSHVKEMLFTRPSFQNFLSFQVLREHNFDPTVLKRRSVPEEDQRSRTPAEVALWTNHRVMEWLRTVDLSEYAPNLRGSGAYLLCGQFFAVTKLLGIFGRITFVSW